MAEVRLTEAQDWETRWERVKLPLIARPHDLGNIFSTPFATRAQPRLA